MISVGRRWPESGTWVVVPTSATADWSLVAAVLAAASPARVAVVAAGVTAPPADRLLAHVATWASLHDGGKDPLRLADALRVIDAVTRTHDLVLVVGAAGLLVPTGRTGWTTADLAAALGAPVVVVVGHDPRGVNYTTVEALEARGLASALVTVGEAPKQLPAAPSGRIPARVGELDAETARGFLAPHLHAPVQTLATTNRTAPRRRAPAGTGWPESGPWVVAPASATVDWTAAVTVLAAASTARVAAVTIGTTGPPAARTATHLGTWIALRAGARDPLRTADAVAVSEALARTHELVLVVAAAERDGHLGGDVPGLAAALDAPVVVVTGDDVRATADGTPVSSGRLPAADATDDAHTDARDAEDDASGAAPTAIGDRPRAVTGGDPADDDVPRAGNGHAPPTAGGNASPPSAGDAHVPAVGEAHVSADDGPARPDATGPGGRETGGDAVRLLGAIEGRGLTALVVTVGGDAAGDALPVPPAGRIPAGAGPLDADAARALLDPRLHATPAPVPGPAPVRTPILSLSPRQRTGGARVVTLLVAIFVIMSVSAVGMAYCNRTAAVQDETGADRAPDPAPPVAHPPVVPTADLCQQSRLAGTPTRPDADVSARVGAAWTRIETWLAANAPESFRSLGPPATSAVVDMAQLRMSVAFPPDLAASLMRHDGTGRAASVLAPGFSLMNVMSIVERRVILCQIASGNPDLSGYWWAEGFVPFAEDWGGGHLIVDQRPGNHGRVGEFFDEDGVSFAGQPASVLELLELTATSLETGRPGIGDVRPVVENGYLLWS